jgi:hypothetical protein
MGIGFRRLVERRDILARMVIYYPLALTKVNSTYASGRLATTCVTYIIQSGVTPNTLIACTNGLGGVVTVLAAPTAQTTYHVVVSSTTSSLTFNTPPSSTTFPSASLQSSLITTSTRTTSTPSPSATPSPNTLNTGGKWHSMTGTYTY